MTGTFAVSVRVTWLAVAPVGFATLPTEVRLHVEEPADGLRERRPPFDGSAVVGVGRVGHRSVRLLAEQVLVQRVVVGLREDGHHLVDPGLRQVVGARVRGRVGDAARVRGRVVDERRPGDGQDTEDADGHHKRDSVLPSEKSPQKAHVNRPGRGITGAGCSSGRCRQRDAMSSIPRSGLCSPGSRRAGARGSWRCLGV